MILRSEPSSRAALMGEQPNPWDLLQPQDATSRHRTFAPHSCGSRLYLHPALFRERARGQRLIAAIDLSCDKVRYLTVLFRERTDQSLRGQTLYLQENRLPTVLSPSQLSTRWSEFTVISWYFLLRSSRSTPQMLRCQTSPSLWTLGGDQPVIPGVAFIR